MTPEQLNYFLVIEKHMNFSAAAEELNISQSSLSRQIRNLEDEIGVTLFRRTTRKIELTEAGADFSLHARRILGTYQNMYAKMKEHSAGRNKIVLASVPVMSIYRLTEMIASFNELWPDVTIDIIEYNTIVVLEALKNRKSDIIFTGTNRLSEEDFIAFPLIEDETVLITNKNHRFAKRNIMSLSEAADEKFIFLGYETKAYNTCVEACVNAGFQPKVINTGETNMYIETIIDFVLRGMGISLINARAAEYFWKPDLRIIRLEEKLPSEMGFVVRNEPIPAVCRELIDFAQQYYHGL